MLYFSNLLTWVTVALSLASAAPTPPCQPTYTTFPYLVHFETIQKPGCYMGCDIITSAFLTTPRGAGLALSKFAQNRPEKPLLFPNLSQWEAINCSAPDFAGTDKANACVSGTKALYSGGGSKDQRATLGSDGYVGEYTIFALDALTLTPISPPAGTKKAEFEIRGTTSSGQVVKEKVSLDLESTSPNFDITGLKSKGFTELRKLDFLLSVDGTDGQAFAIDNLQMEEMIAEPLPYECLPTPTWVDSGACKATPTSIATFTADAEDLTNGPPRDWSVYQDLNWAPSSNVQPAAESDLASFYPPISLVPSNERVYKSYTPLVLSANSLPNRFGVRALKAACNFPQDDTSSSCELTFVGRRDPYDGDGLTNVVVGQYSIANPSTDRPVSSRGLTQISLDDFEGNSVGAFRRLWWFGVFAKIGDNTAVEVVVDDVVFDRETTKGECTAGGLKTLDFEDLASGPVPSPYKGFSATNFEVASALDESVALRSTADYSILDAYISPKENQLIDLHSATITVDIPSGSTAEDVTIVVNALDACGSGTVYPLAYDKRLIQYFNRAFGVRQAKYQWAEPLRAVSQVSFQAFVNENGNNVPVAIWVDDVKYREFKGETPGCNSCGRRNADWCEAVEIQR